MASVDMEQYSKRVLELRKEFGVPSHPIMDISKAGWMFFESWEQYRLRLETQLSELGVSHLDEAFDRRAQDQADHDAARADMLRPMCVAVKAGDAKLAVERWFEGVDGADHLRGLYYQRVFLGLPEEDLTLVRLEIFEPNEWLLSLPAETERGVMLGLAKEFPQEILRQLKSRCEALDIFPVVEG